MTQLWACVPLTGMPNSLPASTFDVAAQPPMYAARLAERPPSMPWARRSPNSSTGSPGGHGQMRAAFVAISVWKLMMFSSGVSSNLALQNRSPHAHERLVAERQRSPRASRRRRT